MTDSLFTDQNDQNQIDPNKNYLEELVGEGKKFKTVEELARGKYEADNFINFKNKEYDALREDYIRLREEHNAGPKLQELIDRLAKEQQSSSDDTIANDNKEKPPFDPTQIDTLIESKILEKELLKRQEENYNKVATKLREQYGANYAHVLKQKSSELGLSEDWVNDTARKYPDVLFRALGLDAQPRTDNFMAPPQTQRRTDTFAPNVPKRTWTYYEKMRKENPSQYTNPKTQLQMYQDRLQLGDAFKDGDYDI